MEDTTQENRVSILESIEMRSKGTWYVCRRPSERRTSDPGHMTVPGELAYYFYTRDSTLALCRDPDWLTGLPPKLIFGVCLRVIVEGTSNIVIIVDTGW